MLYKLAWRNIWRNRRRTLITAASILFAVLFASLMSSIQKGAWDHMVSNVVNYYFGYAQIHKDGYWDEQSLNKAFNPEGEIQRLKQQVSNVNALVPRIESFALASYGKSTRGALVVGVDPIIEDQMTKLSERVTQGSYFEANDQAVLVAEGVAEKLGLGLGDTLVLISQGYHGVNAAGKFPVKGLLKFSSPDLNKQMIYLPLAEAQYFYGADNLVTTLALQIDDPSDVPETVQAVKANLPAEQYEVLDWKEMLPELLEAQQLDTAGNNLVLLLLYLIIAFGIFGTVLMMTKEREYEFGVLISIGMSRWKLAATVWMETIFIGLLGAIAGILLSAPLVYYFHLNPIDVSAMGEEAVQAYEQFGMEPLLPAAFEWTLFAIQALIIFIITSLLVWYPIWKISRLQPVEAMRA